MTGDEAAEGSGACDDMVRAFRSWGLPVPPVPAAFRPALRVQGERCWATREIVGMDMYFWRLGEVEDFLAGQALDYVAVSYAGHGVNSYAFTYHLVYRGLAVFVQEGWGGVYMDKDVCTAAVAELFGLCHHLVARWEERGPGEQSPRLLCLDSSLRDTSACGLLPEPGPAGTGVVLRQFLGDCKVPSGRTVRHGLHLLEGGRQAP